MISLVDIHLLGSSFMFLLDSCVMLQSDIGMTKNVRNHVYIACFVVKSGSVCTSEFMWGKSLIKPH